MPRFHLTVATASNTLDISDNFESLDAAVIHIKAIAAEWWQGSTWAVLSDGYQPLACSDPRQRVAG